MMHFKKSGFALIEIIIATAILSIVVLSIYSGISNGSLAIARNRNLTHAILIAKSSFNEYQLLDRNAPDVQKDPVKGHPGFFYSRQVARYENPILGPIPARKVIFNIYWQERGSEKHYTLVYIYPVK